MVDRSASLAAIGLILVLAGCGEDTSHTAARTEREADRQATRDKREAAHKAEIALMGNPAQAGYELQQRLLGYLKRTGPVIVVRARRLPDAVLEGLLPASKEFTVAALPLNTPWIVKCTRQGIQVVFGALASGEVSSGGGALDADIVVELTASPMTSSQCDELVPQVAAVMVQATKPAN